MMAHSTVAITSGLKHRILWSSRSSRIASVRAARIRAGSAAQLARQCLGTSCAGNWRLHTNKQGMVRRMGKVLLMILRLFLAFLAVLILKGPCIKVLQAFLFQLPGHVRGVMYTAATRSPATGCEPEVHLRPRYEPKKRAKARSYLCTSVLGQ